MLKIALSQLEDLRQNQAAFKARLLGTSSSGRSYTITQATRDAILLYHKQNSDSRAAMDYLEGQLDRFTNRSLCERAVGNLQWYIAEHQKLGWITFQQRLRVVAPLSTTFADSVVLSGQVARVDMRPNEGYGAWLIRRGGADTWLHELQMPIFQNAVAVALGRPPAEFSIGVFCLSERYSDFVTFTERQIAAAHLELERLLRAIGL